MRDVVPLPSHASPTPNLPAFGTSVTATVTLPGSTASVVFVVPTMEKATSQVARLNALDAEKHVTYFWQTTRYYPNGRSQRTTDET